MGQGAGNRRAQKTLVSACISNYSGHLHIPRTCWAPEPSPEGGHPSLGEAARAVTPTSRSRVRSGAGQDKDAPFLLSLHCIMSANKWNNSALGGLLTPLGINCDHPNKYRQITLKTYIYEAHLFKTFSNSENTCILPRGEKKKKNTSSIQSCMHPFLSPLAADAVCLILSGPDDLMSHLKPVKGQRN